MTVYCLSTGRTARNVGATAEAIPQSVQDEVAETLPTAQLGRAVLAVGEKGRAWRAGAVVVASVATDACQAV